MRVCCVICGDLFLQGQDVSATPCGHTFHTLCIIQWLERSKSCPQCRTKATERTLKKLFFDAGSTEGETDPDALQQQIDNLKFQLKLKEQEIKKTTDNAKSLEAQNVALREEFRGSERVIRDRDTTILALKTQLQYVDRATGEAKKAKNEVKELKEELKLLKGMKKVLGGTTEEVTTLVNSEAGTPSGLKSLATFCSVLKKELSKALDDRTKLWHETNAANRKCKEAVDEVKNLKQEVNDLNIMVRHLEQDNDSLEKDNSGLKKKIGALEKAIASPSDDVRNSALHRLLFESPAPALLKRLHSAEGCDSVTPEVVRKKTRNTEIEETQEEQDLDEAEVVDLVTHPPEKPRAAPETLKALELEEDEEEQDAGKEEVVDLVTPPPKHKKLASTTVRPLSDSLNILKGTKGHYNGLYSKASTSRSWKDRKLQGHQVGYDGLGGHHRVDEFPKPGPLLVPLSKKSLYKPAKKQGSQARGKTNALTDYFKNTFED